MPWSDASRTSSGFGCWTGDHSVCVLKLWPSESSGSGTSADHGATLILPVSKLLHVDGGAYREAMGAAQVSSPFMPIDSSHLGSARRQCTQLVARKRPQDQEAIGNVYLLADQERASSCARDLSTRSGGGSVVWLAQCGKRETIGHLVRSEKGAPSRTRLRAIHPVTTC